MRLNKKITSLLLIMSMALTGYSCGNSADESSNTATSTDSSSAVETVSDTTAETIQTEAPTEPPKVESKYRTLIGTSCSFQVPRNWEYKSSYMDGLTFIWEFDNGNFSCNVRVEAKDKEQTDDEYFTSLLNQLQSDSSITNIEVVQLDELKYAYYYSAVSDAIKGYMFVKDEYLYYFTTGNLNMVPNGDETMQNVLKSFEFNSDKFDYSFSSKYDTLTSDEKQFVNETLPFVQFAFANDKTVVINKCGKTLINDKVSLVYDLSYLSKSNVDENKIYIYYRDELNDYCPDQEFSELISADEEYDASKINQVVSDYLKQL